MAIQFETETSADLSKELRTHGAPIGTKNVRKVLHQLIDSLMANDKVTQYVTGAGVAINDSLMHVMVSGAAITGFKPDRIGQLVFVTCHDSGSDPTLKCTAGTTFRTSGGTFNTATFPDAGDSLILVSESLTSWLVLVNEGAVTLSNT